MFTYSHNGITIASMLDNRKETKDGLYPIKIRVTYKRDRKYYSTGKYLSIEDWQKMPESKSKKLNEIKSEVQISFKAVEKNVEGLIREDVFSFENLNKRLGKGNSDTVNTSFQCRIDRLDAEGKVSTSDWYKYTLKSISAFAGERIRFDQITVDWLGRYEQHLLSEGKSYTTVSMYMRALKVIINDAKKVGIIKEAQYPFGVNKDKYSIPNHEGRNIALTVQEVGKIVNYKCSNESMAMCRDLWFFSYLCNGANITDVCKFKFSNIKNGELCFYRQKTINKVKTKKEIRAILTPEMQLIIDTWGNKLTSKDGLIFPFLKGNEDARDERRVIKNITRLINDKLTIIAKDLGLQNVTTYTARHSFATVLKRSGANIAFISDSLGHTDLRTTESYLASFEVEERLKNASLLTKF